MTIRSGGPENDFTQRNATFMAWNLMHFARMLKNTIDNRGVLRYHLDSNF